MIRTRVAGAFFAATLVAVTFSAPAQAASTHAKHAKHSHHKATPPPPAPLPVAPLASRVKPAPAPAPAPQTLQAYVTGYSYFDNTPPGSPAISNPVIHQTAAGTGTYADPITLAVGHSIISGRDVLDWPAGTKFYLPNLRRYFIVEDTCGDGGAPQNGPCHTGYPAPATTWLDVWVDGRSGTAAAASACESAITGVWTVVKDPASNYAVVTGPIVGANGCSSQYGNGLVTAR